MPTEARKAAGARLCRVLALCLFALPAWGAEYWATQAGAGAKDGTSLADAWAQDGISYGGVNAAGRGDILYLCGTPDAPITAAVTPSGIGAFDGTVDALSDVLWLSGDAEQCGGTQGVLDVASGHAITISQAGIYMTDMTCRGSGTSQNCFNQLMGSTAGCVAADGYYCGLQDRLTCSGPGVHCASIGAAGNTNFPATQISGLVQRNITSSGRDGAACRIAINAVGAIQDQCHSDGDAQTENTWGVYQRGVTLNCGVGAGVTWTQVSGNVYRTAQSNCGATINTVVDVYAANPAASVPGRLVLEAGCDGDVGCGATLDAGEYGVVTGTVYINIGKTPSATAAVYLTYGWNTNPIIRDSIAVAPGSAYDGVGLGCDFGTDGCIIDRVFGRDAPGYVASCGAGSKNCLIRSSICAGSAGLGCFRLNSGADAINLSTAGNDTGIYVYTLAGETSVVTNVAAEATNIALDGRGEGTLTVVTSTADPQFVGGTSPNTVNGFRLRATSPGIASGGETSGTDFYGDAWYDEPDIGAMRRDACYRRSRDGKLDMARTRSQVVSRCLGVPGRYPEGL